MTKIPQKDCLHEGIQQLIQAYNENTWMTIGNYTKAVAQGQKIRKDHKNVDFIIDDEDLISST